MVLIFKSSRQNLNAGNHIFTKRVHFNRTFFSLDFSHLVLVVAELFFEGAVLFVRLRLKIRKEERVTMQK